MKNSMRLMILIGCFMVGLPTVFASDVDDFKGKLPNVVFLEEGLISGGVPNEEAFKLAKGKDYKTVIDFRTPEEGVAAEKELAGKYGLNYVNIPTSAENLSRQQADQLNDILSRDGAKPAILHCASGNRSAAVWAAYRKFHKGDTADKVLAEASQKGLKSSLKPKLAKVIAE